MYFAGATNCVNVSEKATPRQSDACFQDYSIWFENKAVYRNDLAGYIVENSVPIDCKFKPVHAIGGKYVAKGGDMLQDPIKLEPNETSVDELMEDFHYKALGPNNFRGMNAFGKAILWASKTKAYGITWAGTYFSILI